MSSHQSGVPFEAIDSDPTPPHGIPRPPSGRPNTGGPGRAARPPALSDDSLFWRVGVAAIVVTFWIVLVACAVLAWRIAI